MDVDEFWSIVDGSRAEVVDAAEPDAAIEQQVGTMRVRLGGLGVEELLAFQQRLHEQVARAGGSRLWAAGFVAAGGMSEDAFDYFRLWLVAQGRAPFERVLIDPDELADLLSDDAGAAFAAGEDLAYVVEQVLEDRGTDPGDALVSALNAGVEYGDWFEDDDEWFAATFPRLWARAESRRPVDAELDRITQDDVARFVERTREAKAPRPVEPTEPLLAAELYELGHIRPQDRPMLAAHWIAEGREGEALLELASLRGHEPEVSELWPLALRELDVMLPITTRPREAMAWAARRVLDGERDARWLVRVLWPALDEPGTDPEFDVLIYTIDDVLDWTDRDLASRNEKVRARASLARLAVQAAVEAIARDDVPGALAAFDTGQPA